MKTIATGEMITPYRPNHNPSLAERAATERHRLECLARWKQSRKQNLIDAAHAEVESIREWNAYAARNRQADGLGHLNNIPDFPTRSENSNTNLAPTRTTL